MAAFIEGEDARPAKRRKVDYLEPLTILVGKKEAKHSLPKNIACEKSAFFKTMRERQWKGTVEGVVHFPEVDPKHFAVYVGFCHSRTIDLTTTRDSLANPISNPSMSRKERCILYDDMVDCFALGELLQDNSFWNAVCDEAKKAIYATHRPPSTACTNRLFEKVPVNSRMGRLLVDIRLMSSIIRPVETVVRQMTAEVTKAIAIAAIEERHLTLDERRPRNRARCHYHDHESDEDKCE